MTGLRQSRETGYFPIPRKGSTVGREKTCATVTAPRKKVQPATPPVRRDQDETLNPELIRGLAGGRWLPALNFTPVGLASYRPS